MMLLKTISLFRQGPVQVTCLTGHKRFHNRAFILISHDKSSPKLCFYRNSDTRVGTSLVMDPSWNFHLLDLVVKNDVLRLLYLPMKALPTTIMNVINDMPSPRFMQAIWHCLHVWRPWDQKACASENNTCFYDKFCRQLSSCFLINYI